MLSGDEDAVSELAERWRSRGRLVENDGNWGWFTHAQDRGNAGRLAEVASGVSFQEPRIPVVSISLVSRRAGSFAHPTIGWRTGVWDGALARWGGLAGRQRRRALLELGPDGVLGGAWRQCLVVAELAGDGGVAAPRVPESERPASRDAIVCRCARGALDAGMYRSIGRGCWRSPAPSRLDCRHMRSSASAIGWRARAGLASRRRLCGHDPPRVVQARSTGSSRSDSGGERRRTRERLRAASSERRADSL